MDLTNVKLVVTDMDGTLLNSKGRVSETFFELFPQMQKAGIHFVAASGRQFYSITQKLTTIKEEISIIAENGGMIKFKDQGLVFNALNNDIIRDLIPLLRKIEDVFIVLCGKKGAYIETEDQKFVTMFREYYPEYFYMDDLGKISDEVFFKIALYHKIDSEKHIYPSVKHLEDELQVKVSGQHWLDIAHPDANKGNALRTLQKELGISEKETMAFGDFNNDLEMLNYSYFSYAVENAHPNIKKAARFSTKSNDEKGVEMVLDQLIQAKKQSVKQVK